MLETNSSLREVVSNNPNFQILAAPLLCSNPVKRLGKVTFLGVLSPKYHKDIKTSLFNTKKTTALLDDGTRLDHSVNVAKLMLNLVNQLNLDESVERYAVAWGLLHDISTWPLSHTGDAAFSNVTGITTKQLRNMIISNDKRLPPTLTLGDALNSMKVDTSILLSLFDRKPSHLDNELSILWQIIHSPITPDSLEGIWRSSGVFGIDIPSPSKVQESITKDLFGPIINSSKLNAALSFWQTKSEVYSQFINNPETIQLESAWTAALEHYFSHLDLESTLFIDEKVLIETVLREGLLVDNKLHRYKHPLKYYVEPETKLKLKVDYPLWKLKEFLKKDEMKDSEIAWQQ